ncbi:MAG: putative IIA-like nitrogen-regulatory protein PtsN [Clostridiaceae bacterium]|jgi:PTS system fructose-specific IIA component|nr:putative IIA-like nitrogen-regulatory protein PtsN [Clostridiaceae bacterium]
MLINKNLIVINMDAKDKKEAINKLIALIKSENKIDSEEEFLKCVLKRESEFSTGVGNGIAIPHGRSETVKEAIVAFGKLNKKIDWNSIDSELVDLIFLLGVPEKNTENLHLKILAQLSRKLMDENFVSQLRDANTEQEIYSLLCHIEEA